eukprot:15469122-Alexandrium_andersonii.AAC.1
MWTQCWQILCTRTAARRHASCGRRAPLDMLRCGALLRHGGAAAFRRAQADTLRSGYGPDLPPPLPVMMRGV